MSEASSPLYTLYWRFINFLKLVLFTIRNNRNGTLLTKLFNEENLRIDDFRVTEIDVSKEKNIVYRGLLRETDCINTLKTAGIGKNKKNIFSVMWVRRIFSLRNALLYIMNPTEDTVTNSVGEKIDV